MVNFKVENLGKLRDSRGLKLTWWENMKLENTLY
jgi:hypothetical protein